LIVIIDGSGTSTGPGYEVFRGEGNGTLKLPSSKVPTPASMDFAAVSDFNHDGKLDLALGAGLGTVWLAKGNGDASFLPPLQVFNAGASFEDMLTGDFDGDANADLVIRQDVCQPHGPCYLRLYGLFGNGAGSFTSVITDLPLSQSYVGRLSTYDVNKDGRSDLLGPGGDQTNPWVLAAYGTSNREFSIQAIPAGFSPDMDWPSELTLVAAADLIGDGLNDLVYFAIKSGSNVSQIGYNLGQPNGTFGPTVLYPYGNYSDGAAGGVLVGDYNRDRKSDVAISDGSGQMPDYTVDLLLNTSTGNFPKCSPPTRVGIHVCSPTSGSSVTSPVRFSVAATSFTPIRKIEIWIDGRKLSETYNSLADQSFVDKSFSLLPGTHHVGIYSVGYDNDFQHTSYLLTVRGRGARGSGRIASLH
jgi:FG-GAP-like repeat